MKDVEASVLATREAGQGPQNASAAVPSSAPVGKRARLLGWRRRSGPLAQRLVEQGMVLFRLRSYFGLALVPGAALALVGRRAASAQDPGGVSLAYFAACMAVTLAGEAIRAATLGSAAPGTSGRDTQQPRAKALNTTGMYAVVRHPIYVGNLLVLVGFSMTLGVAWFVALSVLVYWLLYERVIAAEEKFLSERFGERFRLWAAVTPAFLPSPKLWKKPAQPFSWLSVLRKEYNSLHVITWMFVFLRGIEQTLGGRLPFRDWLVQDRWLLAALGVGILAAQALRIAYKAQRKRSS